jgi:hypothetical protein
MPVFGATATLFRFGVLTGASTLAATDLATDQALYFRPDYFLGRQFGKMKTNQTKHDANSKKISAASRTERTCP